MDERIPTILHPLLQDYRSLIGTEVPGRITAWYLVGSIALGAFNPRLSDIDFVAILDSPVRSLRACLIQSIWKIWCRSSSKT